MVEEAHAEAETATGEAMIELSVNRDHDIVRNLATDIVSAYVAHNATPADSLPMILNSVYAAVSQWGSAGAIPVPATAPAAAAPPPREEPAVSIRQSVTPDFLICLEDGKRFKSLKRHLSTVYDMTPDQYREKWGLPHDYPMTSPNYAKQRSTLARSMGLGRGATGRRRAVVDEQPEQEAVG